MVSKSTYITVFVAVMMATVAVSAVIVSTHEDGIVLDYKGTVPVSDWNKVADNLNEKCKGAPFEIKWSARSNGLLCVCPDDLNVQTLYMLVTSEVGTPLPDGFTSPEELASVQFDPANNYKHWNIYDRM